MISIYQLISRPESSGGINLYNPVSTSSGHAQGWYGITTGTWSDFAPQAGVDTNLYPDPNSAPQSVQQQVASVIPFGRWASSTQQYVASQLGFMPSGSETLGQIQNSVDIGAAADGSYVNAPSDFNQSPGAFLNPGTNDPLSGGFPGGSIDATDPNRSIWQYLFPNGSDPGFSGLPGAAGITSGGSGQTTVSPTGTGLGQILNTFSDIAIRGGLALLGIVLIAVGGYAAVRGEDLGSSKVGLTGSLTKMARKAI